MTRLTSGFLRFGHGDRLRRQWWPAARGGDHRQRRPRAPGGSLAFEPRLWPRCAEGDEGTLTARGVPQYGFVDAFNPATGWYNPDVIGIDVGMTVVASESTRARDGFGWTTFACRAAEAQRWAR
jgi:hypothetical protein